MLKQRVITALLLLGLLGWMLLTQDGRTWSLFLLVVSALAADEWAGLLTSLRLPRGVYPLVTVVLLALLVDLPALHPWQPVVLGASCVFWLACVPVWLARRWVLRQPAAAAAVGWLVILPTALALQLLRQQGVVLLLGAMAVIWVSDSAAYFCGRRFGRRRLAPLISPGKTWEGVAGALAGVAVFGAVLLAPGPWQVALAPLQQAAGVAWFPVLGLLVALGIEGDLLESWVKRCAGAKDSGWVLPGHGGVLDRIDALTAALPLAALLAQWALPGDGLLAAAP